MFHWSWHISHFSFSSLLSCSPATEQLTHSLPLFKFSKIKFSQNLILTCFQTKLKISPPNLVLVHYPPNLSYPNKLISMISLRKGSIHLIFSKSCVTMLHLHDQPFIHTKKFPQLNLYKIALLLQPK